MIAVVDVGIDIDIDQKGVFSSYPSLVIVICVTRS